MTEPFDEHPDEITTASYLDGRLSGPERERFEAHLARCDDCRAGVVMLSGLGEPTTDRVPRSARVAPRRRPALAWVASVAIVVVALGAWLVWRPNERATPGGGDAPVFRDGGSSSLTTLEPDRGAVVDAAELRFRWTAVPGAERYEIVVRDPGGGDLGRLDVRGDRTEASWPHDLMSLRGRQVVWSVRAVRLGRTIAESRPASFEVR